MVIFWNLEGFGLRPTICFLAHLWDPATRLIYLHKKFLFIERQRYVQIFLKCERKKMDDYKKLRYRQVDLLFICFECVFLFFYSTKKQEKFFRRDSRRKKKLDKYTFTSPNWKNNRPNNLMIFFEGGSNNFNASFRLSSFDFRLQSLLSFGILKITFLLLPPAFVAS